MQGCFVLLSLLSIPGPLHCSTLLVFQQLARQATQLTELTSFFHDVLKEHEYRLSRPKLLDLLPLRYWPWLRPLRSFSFSWRVLDLTRPE